MEFKPGPPKQAAACKLSYLRHVVAAGKHRITGGKSVGDGTIKVFMSGPVNYYIESSRELLEFLRSQGVSI